MGERTWPFAVVIVLRQRGTGAAGVVGRKVKTVVQKDLLREIGYVPTMRDRIASISYYYLKPVKLISEPVNGEECFPRPMMLAVRVTLSGKLPKEIQSRVLPIKV